MCLSLGSPKDREVVLRGATLYMEIRTFVKNGGKGRETKDAEMERAGGAGFFVYSLLRQQLPWCNG